MNERRTISWIYKKYNEGFNNGLFNDKLLGELKIKISTLFAYLLFKSLWLSSELF